MNFSKNTIALIFLVLIFFVTKGQTKSGHELRRKLIAKRGVVEDMLTSGDGFACGYIIQFTYTIAQYKLQKVTEYLVKNLPSLITKRDVENADGEDQGIVYGVGGVEHLRRNVLLQLTMNLQPSSTKHNTAAGKESFDDSKIPQSMAKRSLQYTDLFTSMVNSSRGLSCKLIVEYMKYYATSSFKALIQYLTENLTNIVGK